MNDFIKSYEAVGIKGRVKTIQLGKLRVINTVAFAVFCYFLGAIISILLTCTIFDLKIAQLSEALASPVIADKPLLLTQAVLFTTFGFIIIPTLYLLLLRRSSVPVQISWRVRFFPALLIIVMAFSLIPFLSILIELNGRIEFPASLDGLEAYFRAQEDSARQLTEVLLAFNGLKDLMIAILIMAVVPGFAEEFFFRGMIQSQLQNILRNRHYAIALTALLFSVLHFQFYGIVPRLALGVLFGYIFFWSRNIIYPAVAHIVHNSIGVVSAYFLGPEIMDSENGTSFSSMLMLFSVVAVVFIFLYLRKNLSSESMPSFNTE